MSDQNCVPLWAFVLLSSSLSSAIILTRGNGCGVCNAVNDGFGWASYQLSYFMFHPIELLWNPFFWFIVGNVLFFKFGGYNYFMNRMAMMND